MSTANQRIASGNLTVSQAHIVANEIITTVNHRVPTSRKKKLPAGLGQLTVLSLALAASFAPTAAQADCVSGGSITGNVSGDQYWGGGNCSISGSGTISGSSTINGGAQALVATVSVSGGTLINDGRIHGATTGFRVNNNSTVGSLVNNGAISASGSNGIYNYGTIASLTNVGQISSSSAGIANGDARLISSLNNSGTIIGSFYGINNNFAAIITSLTNDKVISGDFAAIYNGNGSTITSLTNNSTIAGGTFSYSAGIQNGSGAIITSLNNTSTGTIRGYTAINNVSAINTLTNSGAIFGSLYGIQNDTGGNITTLDNTGVIEGAKGIYNIASITALTNSGTGAIKGSATAIYNNGTISTLTNNGTIVGTLYGIQNFSGIITSLDNTSTGTIQGSIGIRNLNTIGTLSNSGMVLGSVTGIYNGNSSTITALTNSGTISGNSYGIQSDNGGSITSLNNSSTGLITGGTGVLAGNLTISSTINIGTLNNGGIIAGTTNVGVGTSANASIASLVNSGAITGALGGIGNAGNIGTLANSGTISSGGYAVYNGVTGTLGPITNSGLIAGGISNLSSRGLTINGGSGSTFGTLTGVNGSIGAISNTFSNLTFNSGKLLLNDNINVASNTVSNAGATLQVNNVLTITGNYAQAAGGALLIGVASGAVTQGDANSDSGYGRLVVSGAATIASGSSIGLKSLGYNFASGQRYVVIDAATSGTDYNASTLNYSATGYSGNISGTVVANGNKSDLVLVLGGASTSAGGATTPTAISSLAGLARYTGTSDPALLNLYNASLAANAGTSGEANRVGAQLAPTQASSAASAAAAPTFDVMRQIAARSDNARLAQAYDSSLSSVRKDVVGSGISTGESAQDWAVWGQPYAGRANQSTTNQVDGYRATYNGLVLGADRSLADNWRGGAVASYNSTSINNEGNTSGNYTSVKGYGLLGYASFSGSPWYVNLSAGVMKQDYDTARAINFTGFSGTAYGHFNGNQYVANAEAGYPLKLNEVYTVTPTAGLVYSYQKQDAYTESGGNGAALAVAAGDSTSVRSVLGAKLERSFESSYGLIVPDVQLKWIHEYRNNPMATTASYSADITGQTAFTTTGAAPVRDLAHLSLGVTLLRANNLSLTARYEVQAGSNFVSQTGSLRLRYAM